MSGSNFNLIKLLAHSDVEKLEEAQVSYGDSWRSRGGVGAFMMLARKFDRIEQQAESCNYDIFEAGRRYDGENGLLDDIGDLRRYLFLVEHHIRHSQPQVLLSADTPDPT